MALSNMLLRAAVGVTAHYLTPAVMTTTWSPTPCRKRQRRLVHSTSDSAYEVGGSCTHSPPLSERQVEWKTLHQQLCRCWLPPLAHADLVQTEDAERFQRALRRVEGLVRRNPLELQEVGSRRAEEGSGD